MLSNLKKFQLIHEPNHSGRKLRKNGFDLKQQN